MKIGVNLFLACGFATALQVPCVASHAQPEDAGPPGAAPPQDDDTSFENRWVPSISIMGGANLQKQDGSAAALLFEDMAPDPVPLRERADGDDIVVAPFVGASVEILAPALPVKTRPRFFASGEILPTFASDRRLAIEGDPDCVRGPEPGAPCARDEPPGFRDTGFDEDSANGQGSETVAEIDTLVFGANLGVAFPVQAWNRQIRFKPSAAWINYKVKASGTVVDATCLPLDNPVGTSGCVPVGARPGALREVDLQASDSQRFNGIGGGLDVEVDTGRFGPVGSSLFLGARFYRVVGDRTISFGASEDYDDIFGTDTAAARFEVEVRPWLYRAHVGIRLQWLGLGGGS